jgi:hypothetical protein
MRKQCILGTIATVIFLGSVSARSIDIWLAPPDPITQHPLERKGVFENADAWHHLSRRLSTFMIPVNFLLISPPDEMREQLRLLRSLKIKLSVAMPVLPADKKVCGDGVEGMIWPGEAAQAAHKLKALGVSVDYFAFDLPLTNGHLSKAKNACQFSVEETAKRLGLTVHDLRSEYPRARFIDMEVPTGIESKVWLDELSQWLAAFKQSAGENLYGMTMDIWWKFQWQGVAKETAQLLASRGIRAGVFVNSSEGPTTDPSDWILHAKQNICEVRSTGIKVDYYVIANWLNMRVHNIPESDPQSLTALGNWVASAGSCEHTKSTRVPRT